MGQNLMVAVGKSLPMKIGVLHMPKPHAETEQSALCFKVVLSKSRDHKISNIRTVFWTTAQWIIDSDSRA